MDFKNSAIATAPEETIVPITNQEVFAEVKKILIEKLKAGVIAPEASGDILQILASKILAAQTDAEVSRVITEISEDPIFAELKHKFHLKNLANLEAILSNLLIHFIETDADDEANVLIGEIRALDSVSNFGSTEFRAKYGQDFENAFQQFLQNTCR